MKTLEIREEIEPVNVHGEFYAKDFKDRREVYIDGEKVPLELRNIILAGLDTLSTEYIEKIRKNMKLKGWFV